MADKKKEKVRVSGQPTFDTDADASPQPQPSSFPESHYGKTKTTRDNDHVDQRIGNTPHTSHPESGTPQRKAVPRVQVEDAQPRKSKLREVTKKQQGENPRGQR